MFGIRCRQRSVDAERNCADTNLARIWCEHALDNIVYYSTFVGEQIRPQNTVIDSVPQSRDVNSLVVQLCRLQIDCVV